MPNLGIPDARLTWMRAQVAKLMPQSGTIVGVVRTADGAGGFSEVWSPVTGGTVACRLDAGSSGRLAIEGNRITVSDAMTLTVPYNAPLQADRRFTMSGDTYRVVSINDDSAWLTCITAQVVRLAVGEDS